MSTKIDSPFPPLPKPKSGDVRFHYLNGFCKQDVDPAFVRIYPDILAPRYYILVAVAAAQDVIVWKEAEMAASQISPQTDVPYCSVGLESGTWVQFVRIWDFMVGSSETKDIIGFTSPTIHATPEQAKASGSRKPRFPNGESRSGGGHDGPDTPDRPGNVDHGGNPRG